MAQKKIAVSEIHKHLELELCRRYFLDYLKHVTPNFKMGKHIELLADKAQKLMGLDDISGKENYQYEKQPQILIISLPPQHGKSATLTESFPSWYAGKCPDSRTIVVSYGDDLARRFGRANRRKIEEHNKEIFNMQLDKDGRSETDLRFGRGSMIVRGMMSGITGQPADLILIDDPIKNRQEADSITYRDRMWEEFLNSIYTRLAANGKIILIQTRWHEDDLAGRIIKNLDNDKVEVINIPLEAEENDILGRKIGDSLFPQIGKDNEWLKNFKRTYQTESGTRSWNALMQGRPTSQEGNLLKRNWWKYYKVLPHIVHKVISVDAAFKDTDKSDYVAMQVWGKTGANMYLIDSINERLDFPNTIMAIKNLKSKYPEVNAIFVEDKANGSAVIQVLKGTVGGLIPVNPQGDKVSRVNAISGHVEAGNVYLPSEGSWVHDFVEQCSSFPNATHDDMVDCMSQALMRLIFYHAPAPTHEEKDVVSAFFNKPIKTSNALVDETFVSYGSDDLLQ